jgi:hypothetical protein
MHCREIRIYKAKHVRSGVALRQELFIIQKQEHPPMVPPPVNFPTPVYSNMRAMMKRHEVLEVVWILYLSRPVPNIF